MPTYNIFGGSFPGTVGITQQNPSDYIGYRKPQNVLGIGGIKFDKFGNYDMLGKTIKNIGFPEENNDAATRGYVDSKSHCQHKTFIVKAKPLINSQRLNFETILKEDDNFIAVDFEDKSKTRMIAGMEASLIQKFLKVQNRGILRITISATSEVEDMHISCYRDKQFYSDFKVDVNNLHHVIICEVDENSNIHFTYTMIKAKQYKSEFLIIIELIL